MRITVEYHGTARESAGTATQSLACDEPCTVGELVSRLARTHAGRLAALLLDGDRLSRSVLLAVNDQQVNGMTLLRNGDVVSIIPPVSGGAT